jgi:hypothetical protein
LDAEGSVRYGARNLLRSRRFHSGEVPREAAGAGSPEGRTLHVALESDGLINVFDIWESQELFEKFGATLMPILAGLGVELREPMIATVSNVIKG